MPIERLTTAQAVNFLREITPIVHIPPGTTLVRIDVAITPDGPAVSIARDEPDVPVRPVVIQRVSESTEEDSWHYTV